MSISYAIIRRAPPQYLSDEVSIKKLFQVDMIQLASSFPFLGHGILSVAYSHLALLGGDSAPKAKLIADASWHLSVALPYYLQSIENITEENCNVLFAFATLMVLHTFVTASEDFEDLLWKDKYTDSQLQRAQSLINATIRVVQNIRGIFFVFFKYQHWISKGTLSPVAQRHAPPILTGPQTSWALYEDSRLSELGILWQEDSTVDEMSSRVLSDALLHLREAFRAVTHLTVLSEPNSVASDRDLGEIHEQLLHGRLDDLPCAFTWQISTVPAFFTLLERQNPYAVVLLAHYAILLDRACSRAWWIRSFPSQLVATALLSLDDVMHRWIEWPKSVVGVGVLEGHTN